MKVSAVQLNADFAETKQNLIHSENLIANAAEAGAELLMLPEFFTSAIGFSEKMLNVVKDNARTEEWMLNQAEKNNMIIGGSFLSFDGENVYNLFLLVFPNGQIFRHRKDIPTQFENCYYTNGDENNILKTPIGNIGVALCWELIRYDTLRRISGKVDFILAGSCWWDLPEDAPKEREPLRQYNQKLALETPAVFARLAGVPLIHANHCGKVTAYNFPAADKLQTRQLVGAAQIVEADGIPIKKRSFSLGEGIVTADISINPEKCANNKYPDEYWIPKLPDSYINAWEKINPLGKEYYMNITKPRCKNEFDSQKNY